MNSKPPIPATARTVPRLRAVLALAGLVVLFVVGAYLYVHVGGNLLAHAKTLPAPLLVGLVVVGGATSFFSPCSVAITPSFLAYVVGPDPSSAAKGRALVAPSAWVAFGIVSFYAVAGVLIGWIGAQVYNVLVYLIIVVGLMFLWLGYELLTGRDGWLARLGAYNPANRFYERQMAPGRQHKRSHLYAFGWGYGAASHTCTLPIFLGVVLAPLATGQPWLAGVTTVVYGGAIATLLIVMGLLGGGVLTGLKRRMVGRTMQMGMGALFLLTGGYLIYYFLQNFGGIL